MTSLTQLKDRHALVTGGSTGIGAAIAAELARNGTHLVLVARDARQLEVAAADLQTRFGVAVLTIAVDLAEPGAVAHVLEVVEDAGIEIELLVNSAGMSSRGFVADSDPSVLRRLVELNVGALTELTASVVAGMVERGHGAIVNVASTGAYAPAPVLAAYAASKAYVLSFTQALWAETRDAGVRVVAVSPGPTRTPMNTSQRKGMRQPAQVARTVLRALEGAGPALVDGATNAVTVAAIRLLPARVITAIARRAMGA